MNKLKNPEIDATETLERSTTLLALSGLAIVAYLGERYQLTAHLPEELKDITDSCAHPVLGYAGAWVGSNIPKFRNFGSLVVAGVANFATEVSQSLVDSSSLTATWLTHNTAPETAKDFAFALGGLCLFLARNKQQG